ncbi:hypothetical protein [Glutamicibacter sp. NPDC087344]|uniref:hypothetical protein n=1 Tax=Glutamicibacter sp. NPDC087344 TaxID=3363994 RepID=UPI0038088AEC
MTSEKNNMRNGQPIKYWRYRNLVSAGQIIIVLGIAVVVSLWASTDGNGERVWQSYLDFSSSVSDFANNRMSMPWE